jgi:carbohydrate kinase (thermoresistant glucokinase family)
MNDWRIVVMGVSGCGKSSVGIALAAALGARFIDGDDLHPEANKAKMSAGIPLDDSDRWPWLDLVSKALAEEVFETSGESFTGTVVACSALKRVYRERILAGAPNTFFVHLDGSREILEQRLGARSGHFMPASLLDSQLATLETLGADEPGCVLNVEDSISQLVEQACQAWFKPRG